MWVVYKVVCGDYERVFFCKKAAIQHLLTLFLSPTVDPKTRKYPLYLSTYSTPIDSAPAFENKREVISNKALIDLVLSDLSNKPNDSILLSDVPLSPE
jgi:hypothetical protein